MRLQVLHWFSPRPPSQHQNTPFGRRSEGSAAPPPRPPVLVAIETFDGHGAGKVRIGQHADFIRDDRLAVRQVTPSIRADAGSIQPTSEAGCATVSCAASDRAKREQAEIDADRGDLAVRVLDLD